MCYTTNCTVYRSGNSLTEHVMLYYYHHDNYHKNPPKYYAKNKHIKSKHMVLKEDSNSLQHKKYW